MNTFHLQEFSDEDIEEDIDALMSAHSMSSGRRLSNAVSTVTPMSNPPQTQTEELRKVLSGHRQFKHIHSLCTHHMHDEERACSSRDWVNTVWALSQTPDALRKPHINCTNQLDVVVMCFWQGLSVIQVMVVLKGLNQGSKIFFSSFLKMFFFFTSRVTYSNSLKAPISPQVSLNWGRLLDGRWNAGPARGFVLALNKILFVASKQCEQKITQRNCLQLNEETHITELHK